MALRVAWLLEALKLIKQNANDIQEIVIDSTDNEYTLKAPKELKEISALLQAQVTWKLKVNYQ